MNDELPQPQQGSITPPGPASDGNGGDNGDRRKALPLNRPSFRRLRAYAFDPSLSTQLEMAIVNNVVLKVPWEFDPVSGKDSLQPGPVGEYLEVVDYDPASNCFYAPVDLNNPYLLAQDGLDPSEGNPQFHQQMVYAVAMTTIRNFERALGRTAFWAPHYRQLKRNGKPGVQEEYVQRLRIYPHALREANAYYSPQKKALLFGYFPATVSDSRYHLPGGMVFTCLSHDIIAHETTHALLDGIHRRFNEPTNSDVLAFHEAFADIVALFQHFSFPEVLQHQIAKTRGDLATENLLGQLAQQFGQATGAHGSLRDALGKKDAETGEWKPEEPDPMKMQTVIEPHARGSLLVAAVFDAFVTIYKTRIADLLRIATNGTGVLPEGRLHPDLVNRLAAEAAKSAQHILNMCIRALDYCPPVDITFGDYLRALITADYDLVRDDDRGYRIAVIEAFRKHGIYPRDVRSLAEDSLRWQQPGNLESESFFMPFIKELRAKESGEWDLSSDRARVFEELNKQKGYLNNLIKSAAKKDRILKRLKLNEDNPRFEVHAIRPLRRVGPDGELLSDMVIEITQQRPGYFDSELQRRAGQDSNGGEKFPPRDFTFRGGCTLIVDMENYRVRYNIYKNIDNESRLARQRAFHAGGNQTSLRATYFGDATRSGAGEPFALLHRSAESEELL